MAEVLTFDNDHVEINLPTLNESRETKLSITSCTATLPIKTMVSF